MSAKVEVVTLPNGRQVTQGTAWWVDKLSGARTLTPGKFLYCVHNVPLSERCEDCKAAA